MFLRGVRTDALLDVSSPHSLRREARSVTVKRLFSFLVPIFFSSLLAAQTSSGDQLTTDPRNLTVSGNIVITAAALPEKTENTTAAVTVISRDELEKRKVRDVATLLREVPGLVVSRSGSEGKATSLFTRGSGSKQTLVLWNGLQLNSPYFSGYDWGRFSTAGVQQVEVVRGPYSALYGSDAMAGVVNVLTSPRGNDLDVDLEAGERGLRNAAIDGSLTFGSLAGQASFERRDDDGFHLNDDFSQNAATGGITWTAPRGLSVGLEARHTDYDLGIPFNTNAAGDALVPSLHRRQNGTEQQIAIPLRQSIGAFAWELTASDVRQHDEFADPEDPFFFTESTTDARTRRLQGTVRLNTFAGTLIAGGDIERARVDDASSYGVNLSDHRRNGTALFLEDRFSRQLSSTTRLDLNLGVRRDSFKGCEPSENLHTCGEHDLGSETSPRVGAALTVGVQKFRASYGEGFRAPSVGELYFPFFGNRDLEAEHSRNWEIGYDRALWANSAMTFTLFESRYRNLITFDNALSTFGNVSRARSRGAELGIRASLGALSANASYTWLQTRQNDDETLLRVPKHSGSLALNYDWQRTTTTLVVVHSGSRDDLQPIFPYGRVTNDAYTTVDAMFQLRVATFTPYVRIENLTGEKYDEVLGFASPGRRALIGLRYSVK